MLGRCASRMKPLACSQRHVRLSAAGFTLVEVVVAITLLSLICLALFSAIHLSTRAWERSAAPLEVALETQSLAALMRRQLAQTHAIFTQDGGNLEAAFAGDASGMRFVSPLPAHRGVAGLYLMDLRVNGRGELTLGYEIYRPDRHLPISAVEPQNIEVIGAGFDAVRFEYADVLSGETTQWRDDAGGGGRFPEAVRLVSDAGPVPRVLGTFALAAQDSRFRVSSTGLGGAGQGDVGTDSEQGPAPEPAAPPPSGASGRRVGRSLDMWRGDTPYYEDFEYVPPTETGPPGTPGCGTDYIC